MHIVCNNPVPYPAYGNAETVLLVNISSIDPAIIHDPTTLLDVGDHPFIKRPSYVYYRKADIYSTTSLVAGVADKSIILKEICPDHSFTRILDGFKESKLVLRKIKNYYQKYVV